MYYFENKEENVNQNSDFNSDTVNNHDQKKPDKKTNRFGGRKPWMKYTAAALAFGLIAGSTGVGINYAGSRWQAAHTTSSATFSNTTANATKTSSTTSTSEKVASQVLPSVVAITSVSTSNGNSMYGMMSGQEQETEGAGSGFIISKTSDKVMIATNYHVVEGANQLSVAFNDGKSAYATIVGTDSTNDLAVISVNLSDLSSSTQSAIKVATLGDSDNLKAGQSVIAIGNALGYGQSVTTGVISATSRTVTFDTGSMKLIQTDAAINPGNSGGVLVNTDGEVIGINNAKLEDTSVEGMGYAIPMSTAKSILAKLEKGESTGSSSTSSQNGTQNGGQNGGYYGNSNGQYDSPYGYSNDRDNSYYGYGDNPYYYSFY